MEWKKLYENNRIDYTSNWLITYSDMITIILCFFIVFFTFSAKENTILESIKDSLKVENENLKEEQKSLKELLFGSSKKADDFLKFIEENKLKDSIEILEEKRGVVVRFKDNIIFPSGRAEISPDGYKVLGEVAKVLEEVDNLIIIEGYTDNSPIKYSNYPSNWELSTARAIGVAKELINNFGISEERVSVSGYGEQKPLASNSTEEGRKNNRRIEIVILN